MSGHLIETLEGVFATRFGLPGAVATGLGRSAIYVVMETIGVRGARVLVPDFVCQQVLQAVELAGGIPVFYPVPLDLAVRPEDFAAVIAPEARAALFVHYFGIPQPHLPELIRISRQRGIAVVEDCALALLTPTEGGLCGTLGDFSAFSFTKSNWCFGGGMAAARDAGAVTALRRRAAALLQRDDEFCRRYGCLSEQDFAANRPGEATAAAERGYQLQQEFALQDPRFAHENFFDAAPVNLAMSPAAAERAAEILQTEAECAAQRRGVIEGLLEKCQHVPSAERGEVRLLGKGRNGSYLVLLDEKGRAGQRIELAHAQGVTLRPAWCNDQRGVQTTAHRQKLLFLEVHPQMSPAEIAAVAKVLNSGS